MVHLSFPARPAQVQCTTYSPQNQVFTKYSPHIHHIWLEPRLEQIGRGWNKVAEAERTCERKQRTGVKGKERTERGAQGREGTWNNPGATRGMNAQHVEQHLSRKSTTNSPQTHDKPTAIPGTCTLSTQVAALPDSRSCRPVRAKEDNTSYP